MNTLSKFLDGLKVLHQIKITITITIYIYIYIYIFTIIYYVSDNSNYKGIKISARYIIRLYC